MQLGGNPLSRFLRTPLFFSQILVVISIVMDSDSECDRCSVSKANTTWMFKARACKGRHFQGLTQAAAASRAEALEEDVSDEVDADSDEPSHKIILPLSGHKTF